MDEVNRSCDILYSITSKDVLDNLCNGNAKLGILAISNSSAGVVAETLSALSVLAENDDLVKRVHVLDYVSVPVKHDLLCLKDQDINKIDENMVRSWVKELVIDKTFIGLRLQEVILIKFSETLKTKYRLATPEQESKGIDGFLGDVPVSIKPVTYKIKKSLHEDIDVKMIFYDKKNNEIIISDECINQFY